MMAKEKPSRLRLILVLSRVIYELTLRFPFLFVKYFVPGLRPQSSWSYKSSLTAALCKTLLRVAGIGRISPPLVLKEGKEKHQFQLIKPAEDLHGVAAPNELIKPVTTYGVWYPTIPPGQIKGNIVLHFHGGAYVSLSARRADSGWSADKYVEHVVDYVFLAEYRMASRQDGAFPAQLQDAIAAYQHILAQGIDSSKIILAGDSAGGHLVLSLLRYIHDHEGVLPWPKAALLWSPVTDFLTSSDASKTLAMETYDFDVIPAGWLAWGSQQFIHGVDLSSSTIRPYIVPLGNPFYVKIPLWFQVCGLEILHDGAMEFAKEMKGQGNQVTVNLTPSVVHDLFYGNLIGFPKESDKAFRDAGAWVQRL